MSSTKEFAWMLANELLDLFFDLLCGFEIALLEAFSFTTQDITS